MNDGPAGENECGGPPALSIRGLGKAYSAPVLQDVDLDIKRGEIHALMGANGAGKSTLAKIVSGLTVADSGGMLLGGSLYWPKSKQEAERAGVQIVLQELNVLGTLSVAENLFLSRLPNRCGLVRNRELEERARQALGVVGLGHLDPRVPAGRLGVGEQQLVEIASALARPCRLLILDEPTAALTGPQVESLFRQARRLKSEGVGIIFISHRLEEIRGVADRISVLRDGRLVATKPAAELRLEDAVRVMIGEELAQRSVSGTRTRGRVAMKVEGLSRGDRVRGVSFEVHRGEVLGVAGLVGSGRTELLRAIYGADVAEGGSVQLAGDGGSGGGDGLEPKSRSGRFRGPWEAVRAGIGMIPEDRKTEGLLLPLSVAANTTLARVPVKGRIVGWLDRRGEAEATEAIGEEVRLHYRSVDQPVVELSGGNQQKVLLMRWLYRECEVLLLDEPTRGIDVAAKRSVYNLIDRWASEGKAVVVVSSETEELLEICDRIAVLSAGKLTTVFERGEWTHEGILAAAFQEHLGKKSVRDKAGEGAFL